MTKWFKGIRGQLLILVVLPFLMIGFGTFYSAHVMKELSGEVDKLGHVRLPIATHASEMAEAVQMLARGQWGAYANFGEEANRNSFIGVARQAIEQYDKAAKEYEALPRAEAARKLYESAPGRWANLKSISERVFDLYAKNTHESDDRAKALLISEFRTETVALTRAFDELSKARIERSHKEVQEAMSNASHTIFWSLIIGGVAGLALFAAGIWIAGRLTRTIGSIASNISSSASEVASASQQLSDASQKLSSGASEAASSLEETVASLEELSSKVKMNADNSKEAGALSHSARSSAEEGEKEARDLIAAMGDISQSSKKIEEIINVIDDIAFQTNLLALNAAVEAARAGEQGRGFAVVAEAVRNLALRSGSAAKDITSLIKESVDKVDRGTKIVDRSGQTLKQIVVNAKKVADLTTEIAHASEEQAAGLAQISKAMNQLDQATQGNAASAEETASSSEQMQSEAEVLKSQVHSLVQVIDGGGLAKHEKGHQASSPTQAKKPFSAKPLEFKKSRPDAPTSAQDLIPFDDDAAGNDSFKVSGF
jgi:methyl-accepting chemotaxis protein